MTLQDLQERLALLPMAAQTARVVSEAENHRPSGYAEERKPIFFEGQTPKAVRYDHGEVTIVWGD